jgi:predicted HicB family RNase H-like nuclease
MAKITLNVRVNPGIRKRLEDKAEAEGGTLSSVVNHALAAYLDFLDGVKR